MFKEKCWRLWVHMNESTTHVNKWVAFPREFWPSNLSFLVKWTQIGTRERRMNACVHRIYNQVATVTSLLVEHSIVGWGCVQICLSLVLLTARTQMNTNLCSASLHVSPLSHFFLSPSSIPSNCKFLIGNEY